MEERTEKQCASCKCWEVYHAPATDLVGAMYPAQTGLFRCVTCRTRAEMKSHLRNYPQSLSVVKRFYRLIVAPETESFEELHSELLDANTIARFDTLSRELLRHRSPRRRYAAARRALAGGGLLSARVHETLSQAAIELGNVPEGMLEGFLARACLKLLATSGDGTEVAPYLVTDIPDQYALLERQGRESRWRGLYALNGQSLQLISTQGGGMEPTIVVYAVPSQGRFFDIHLCSDQRFAWFDVTRQLQLTPLQQAG